MICLVGTLRGTASPWPTFARRNGVLLQRQAVGLRRPGAGEVCGVFAAGATGDLRSRGSGGLQRPSVKLSHQTQSELCQEIRRVRGAIQGWSVIVVPVALCSCSVDGKSGTTALTALSTTGRLSVAPEGSVTVTA